MKVLILSDVHANLEALQAITESWDELWVLGDLVNYGPSPAEVVDFIREHATVVVRGNHDNAIGAGVDPRCSPAFREMAQAMQAYTEAILTDDQRAYLRHLPLTAQRRVGEKMFFLCHAAPSDPLFRYAPPEPAVWTEEAATVNADVLLVGHTHLPFILDLGAQRVTNPGSVGQPKDGAPQARYAVLEGGVVTLKSAPYAVNETTRKLSEMRVDARIRRQLADVLLTGRPPA